MRRADKLYLARLTSDAFTRAIHANETSNLEFRDNDASISPGNTLGAPAISPDRETRYVPRRVFSKSSSCYVEDSRPLFVLTEGMTQTPFYVAGLN